ncbi:LruC domain-containing protein [Motilimonas eburnea]|uniref:LruC domain-containing protein n=1 Tax=Motilimonas eburnea TaxID=1737488 RepID=UPI001E4DD27A|nr:LruC domain-containing protein [Motilimonas eburnea]MCE2573582.1 LruC domain-containing protein [Motilimonas eburnea]
MKTTKKRLSLLCLLATGAFISTASVASEPFATCPSKAYLFQGNPVTVYGVNLVSGSNSILQDNTGMAGNINGLGFNDNDRYIYGFNTTLFQVVRLDQDFQATPLNVSGLPQNKTFFVGDVFNDTYYLYRKGTGFYRIDLSPLKDDPASPLVAELINESAKLNLTDFAFHPKTNQLYGVDNQTGILYQLDPSNGNTTQIGDTQELGTFGAMYFDVNGFLYLSRNQDGLIYRVDLSTEQKIASGQVKAVKFADGPSSNQNDGARCANAPIIDEDTPANIDFGDAPASYGTNLADNGARHELDQLTWLGLDRPDGEYDGPTGALSDDETNLADEDGVGFVTALEPGLDSVINVQASTSAYLSAWFDWNQDGDFADAGEQGIQDYPVNAGQNPIVLSVPVDATTGNTWSRFRISQQSGLNFDGGAKSGEVEDHAITITPSNAYLRHFPSENGWVTLAFEDNWPQIADYDMNDVVMRYRITEVIADNHIAKVIVAGQLQALGASYPSGFAVRLPNVLAANIATNKLRMQHRNRIIEQSPIEADMLEASFIISPNLNDEVPTGCAYYRSQIDCRQALDFDFSLNISFQQPIPLSEMPAVPYDPFIFATPGRYHGDGFDTHPGRGLEIHLPDQAPTEKFNRDYYQMYDDTSDPQTDRYFKTNNNLPWALMIFDSWQWPKERADLLDAYPQFRDFTESGGQQSLDWFKPSHAEQDHLY